MASVMAARGAPLRRVLLWTAVTSLPQALAAPPAYVFVDAFRGLLPLALGFAAGCMMWVVLAELLPDALGAAAPESVATAATAAAAWCVCSSGKWASSTACAPPPLALLYPVAALAAAVVGKGGRQCELSTVLP